jgi:DNA-binding LacI/PurR family transcriptional regulator
MLSYSKVTVTHKDAMSNIRQVARQAKVSIATVSRVLNGHDSVAPDLRRRVMTAIDACDYAPQVGKRASRALALVYAGIATPSSPYDSACIGGMVEALEQVAMDLTILNHKRDRGEGESFKRFFKRKEVCGVVLRCTDTHRHVACEMAEEGIPVVVVGDHWDHPTLPFIYSNSRQASRDAIDYLCSLGHKRIAFATCERDDGDHVDRYDSYRQVLKEHDLFDDRLVWRIPPHRLDGAQLMRSMMGSRNRPTAAFIADPLVAVGAINEARNMGVRIPEDFSVIGFDDTDTRNTISPTMTAVCQNSHQLGLMAVNYLHELQLGRIPAIDSSIQQQAWLEINHTAGPPPEVATRVLPNGARI